MQHSLMIMKVPQSNNQMKRVNRTLIPLLTKLAVPKSNEWYKYLDVTQLCLNMILHRSIKTTLFHVLFGVNSDICDDPNFRDLLESELIISFDDD